MIDSSVIREIKRRVPLADYIGAKVKLRRNGRGFVGPCPFHPDNTPSFYVYDDPNDQHFHCFGCEKHGDLFTYIEEIEGGTFPEIAQSLAQRAGITLPSSNGNGPTISRAVARTIFYEYKTADGTPLAVHERREDAFGKKIGDMPWHRLEYVAGQNNYRRILGLGDTRISDLPLYRLSELLATSIDEPVLLVEGEKACDALREHGFTAVSLPGGASQTRFGEALEPLRGRAVYPWPDADDQGEQLMRRVGVELQGIASEVRWLQPAGITVSDKDDAFDYFAKGGGVEQLKIMMQYAPIYHPTEAPESNSAGTTGASAETNNNVFVTAREVAESTPEVADWLASGWLAKGCVTEVDAKVKSGKTTWVLAMCRAMVDGAEFMGRPTRKTPVVYLTEQPMNSFREALRRADLLDRDDFYILQWARVAKYKWDQKMGFAVAKALEVGAEVLVIDTLAWWAGLRGDEENSTGAAQQAMEPVNAAASNHGLGIIINRHERKSGGEVGDSGRGASAFAGAVDIVLAIKRPEGNPGANKNMRVVTSLSRFEETPTELMIELTEGGYVAHGDVHAVAKAATREAVVTLLKSNPPEDGGWTFDQLFNGCTERGVRRSTLQETLKELESHGRLSKTGPGKSHNPYRYTWLGP